MSGPPDFRLEHSGLRGTDEFGEFASEDLPYYSDWHGSFEKLPWAVSEAALRASGADAAIVGAPFDEGVSSRREPGSAPGRSGWRPPHGAAAGLVHPVRH